MKENHQRESEKLQEQVENIAFSFNKMIIKFKYITIKCCVCDLRNRRLYHHREFVREFSKRNILPID